MNERSSDSNQIQPANHPTTIRRLDILQLHSRLDEIIQKSPDSRNALQEFLKLTIALINAGGAVFYVLRSDKLVAEQSILSKQALRWTPNLQRLMQHKADMALKNDRFQMERIGDMKEAMIISSPVHVKGSVERCLSVVVIIGDYPLEPFVAILQMVSAYIGLWLSKDLGKRIDSDFATVENVHEAIARALNHNDKKMSAVTFANGLKSAFSCDKAILGITAKNGTMRLEAISDVHIIDQRTKLVRAIQNVMNECMVQKRITSVPDLFNDSANVSPILKTLATQLQIENAICIPLVNYSDRVSGCLILVWEGSFGKIVEYKRLIDHLTPLWTGFCHNLEHKAKESIFNNFLPLSYRLNKLGRILVTLFILVTMVGVSVFPVPNKIKGSSIIRPVVRRYVVAQFDGILQKTFFKPGSVVKKGELLAKIDGKEIELELTTLKADSNKAMKMRDVHMAAGNTAAAQMAALEKQRLDQKIQLLKRRQNQLEIKSPIDGVILSGILERVEGSPLSKGQTLFEVAPLENMLIEFTIPQEDIAYVRIGLPAIVSFDAYPNKTWRGNLNYLLPRSEIRDEKNVFIGELEFENKEGLLRPGMRGEGKIIGSKRPLLWILFHRPWNFLRRPFIY